MGGVVSYMNRRLKAMIPPEIEVSYEEFLEIDKTHKVQPDLVICDKKGLEEQNYKGVPTLVVEVLSPSTASNDYIKKMVSFQSQ